MGVCNIVLCFVVCYFMSILVLQIILFGKRELVALLCLSSWCCDRFVALPHGAMGLSTVCDYGIF